MDMGLWLYSTVISRTWYWLFNERIILILSGGHFANQFIPTQMHCKPNDTSVESMQPKCIKVKQRRAVTHNENEKPVLMICVEGKFNSALTQSAFINVVPVIRQPYDFTSLRPWSEPSHWWQWWSHHPPFLQLHPNLIILSFPFSCSSYLSLVLQQPSHPFHFCLLSFHKLTLPSLRNIYVWYFSAPSSLYTEQSEHNFFLKCIKWNMGSKICMTHQCEKDIKGLTKSKCCRIQQVCSALTSRNAQEKTQRKRITNNQNVIYVKREGGRVANVSNDHWLHLL